MIMRVFSTQVTRGTDCSFADDSTEEEEQDADCVFCADRLSEGYTVEELIRSAKYFRWAHTICVCVGEDFVCEPYQGYKFFYSSLVFEIFKILYQSFVLSG